MLQTHLRSHSCGELNLSDVGKEVALTGWVQKIRELGGMTFIDLRDRYGITQLIIQEENSRSLGLELPVQKIAREFVILAKGIVRERENKNKNLATGEIEIEVKELKLLNDSVLTPFTIEDKSDGGEELRMKYRYLDLRRGPLQRNIQLRHRLAQESRAYLSSLDFLEIETPFLIKSTPEGARDFVVPSRMNPGEFYALPQSPQTFKQLLMLSGFDRYFQIVKCFRDEDLRADRQPEFTQIDCEMAFVDRNDVMRTFEGLVRHLFKKIKNTDLPEFPVMTYDEAMSTYGNDKPDLRFGMKFKELNHLVKGKNFNVFDEAELIVGINAENCGEFTRKQLDELTEFVKKPQIGGKGLVYVKCNEDGTFKSSVDKFYNQEDLKLWADAFNAKEGDLMLIVSGNAQKTRSVLSELRLEMADRLNLKNTDVFKPLWVIDFPLLEWNDESARYFAMHHPFTAPLDLNPDLNDPGKLIANAYDMVINGVEIGGGSIRIHHEPLQKKMFEILGFSDEEAKEQFGFLMNAFKYGAPPHGGIAFGFDRLCAMFGGQESIRDFIAFPKNNSGRDVMLDAPSNISNEQMKELSIKLNKTDNG